MIILVEKDYDDASCGDGLTIILRLFCIPGLHRLPGGHRAQWLQGQGGSQPEY